MSDSEDDSVELRVQDLTVRIDRNACSAFKDCIGVAPEAFRLDENGIVEFVEPSDVEAERLIDACDVCPADALHVTDAGGKRIVPRS